MLTIPHYLTREYCIARPRTLFICATDRTYSYHASESAEMGGLRNIFWLPIKVKPCMDESAFFSDLFPEMFEFQLEQSLKSYMDSFEDHFINVIPNPKFGQSNWAGPMTEKTPKCYEMVREFFREIQTPHEIDYRLKP